MSNMSISGISCWPAGGPGATTLTHISPCLWGFLQVFCPYSDLLIYYIWQNNKILHNESLILACFIIYCKKIALHLTMCHIAFLVESLNKNGNIWCSEMRKLQWAMKKVKNKTSLVAPSNCGKAFLLQFKKSNSISGVTWRKKGILGGLV